VPTLLIRGNDALHPASVSEFYARTIPCCTVVGPEAVDAAATIEQFITKGTASVGRNR
jgi:hypothetical protein